MAAIDKFKIEYQLFDEFEFSLPGRSLRSASNIMGCEFTGEYMAPLSIDHTPVLESINTRRSRRRQLNGKNPHESRDLIESLDITGLKDFLQINEIRIDVSSFQESS